MASLMYRATVRAVHQFKGKLLSRGQKILGSMIVKECSRTKAITNIKGLIEEGMLIIEGDGKMC